MSLFPCKLLEESLKDECSSAWGKFSWGPIWSWALVRVCSPCVSTVSSGFSSFLLLSKNIPEGGLWTAKLPQGMHVIHCDCDQDKVVSEDAWRKEKVKYLLRNKLQSQVPRTGGGTNDVDDQYLTNQCNTYLRKVPLMQYTFQVFWKKHVCRQLYLFSYVQHMQ